MAGTHDRIVAIQGLRALAILLVVSYHLGLPFGAGFIGVDVFFVISGFVITRTVLRQTMASGRLDLKAFWAGRIRRLLPALAAMVAMTAVLASLLTSPTGTQQATALTGLAANFWVSNGLLAVLGGGYFGRSAADNPLGHTWSLAVEEQFYVFFPLLIVMVLWWTRRRGGSATRRVTTSIAAVGLLSFALCLVLTFVRLPLPVGTILAFYSPVTRAWEFAAGALLAIAVLHGWTPGQWARGSLVMGALILGAGLLYIDGGSRFPGWEAAFPVVATVLLIIGSVAGSPGGRALTNRPMVYIGDISYSWYLFHWPLLVFAAAVSRGDVGWPATCAAAAIGFGLAAASYRWLEQPIRKRAVLPRMRTPALAALVTIPAVIACVGLFVGATNGWGRPDVQDMQAQLDHGQWKYQEVCQSPLPVDQRDSDACRIEGDPNRRPLVLVGDSNAGVYAELMVDLAADTRRTVTIATVPSCALVDVQTVAADGTSFLDCRTFYRSTMKWLDDQPPSTVVVASGVAAVDSDLFGLRLPDGTTARTRQEKTQALQSSMSRSFKALQAMGHDVVQVELIPHFLQWRPAQCSMFEILNQNVAACGQSTSRSAADRAQAGALAAEHAATRAQGVPQIALRDALCRPADRCRTNQGNTWLYEDGAHLSFDAALALKKEFATVLSGPASGAVSRAAR